ncbi:DNA repair protein RecO [Rhodobacteraceae bacterium WD3A24]|nr:DNA repair protein RecO [Rhodobacteraceae bacterium WD3A24]
MEWREQGIVLSARRHGESSCIVELFTEEHGRHLGVVRGGAGRRMAPLLQPGAQLDATWRARLEAHIGSYTIEPVRQRAPSLMGDRLALPALSSLCALLSFALAERDPQPPLYRTSFATLDALGRGDWLVAYLRWELVLLEQTGFGLDLARCAVTGAREGLAFVSPRTGRAVSREGAGAWAGRLLPLPECLLGQGPATPSEALLGLRMTGHFLQRRLAPALGERPVPGARARFVEALARAV